MNDKKYVFYEVVLWISSFFGCTINARFVEYEIDKNRGKNE